MHCDAVVDIISHGCTARFCSVILTSMFFGLSVVKSSTVPAGDWIDNIYLLLLLTLSYFIFIRTSVMLWSIYLLCCISAIGQCWGAVRSTLLQYCYLLIGIQCTSCSTITLALFAFTAVTSKLYKCIY